MDSNDGFRLLSNSEKTIDYINKQLINYPKNEVILKQNIEKTGCRSDGRTLRFFYAGNKFQ